MKNSVFGGLLVMALVMMAATACKTTPPVQDDPEVVAKTAPTSDELAALDAAKLAAEEARAAADSIQARDLLVDDWKAAEETMDGAHTLALKATDDADACKEATASYKKAEAAYRAIYADALPLFVSSAVELIGAARQTAIEAGANRYWEAHVVAADAMTDRGNEILDAGDKDAAVPVLIETLDAWNALTSASRAIAVRTRIEEEGYSEDDPQNIALGAASLAAFDTSFAAGSTKAARDSADEALLRYNLALNAGLIRVAGLSSREAEEKKAEADAIKASIAAKAVWDEAVAAFAAGEEAMAAERYDEAIANYENAATLFEQSGVQAADKRARALEAIKAAEEAIRASDEKAAAAEEELGGSN